MRNKLAKRIILSLAIAMLCSPVFAESLFKTGISQNIYPMQPKSLFSSVKAKTIGDLVTVIVNENINTTNDMKLNIKKSSSTTDKFSKILNEILPGNMVPEVDAFGGASSTGNQASVARKASYSDTITAQVVQILPNGNLLIQGKKTAIDGGEKTEIILSGIIDPRMLDNLGRINSNKVSNLQLAFVGNGTVSRSDTEGTAQKIFKYFF